MTNRFNRGFSLMEVMIAVGISSSVIYASLALQARINNFTRKNVQDFDVITTTNTIYSILGDVDACKNTLQGQNPFGSGSAFSQIKNQNGSVKYQVSDKVPIQSGVYLTGLRVNDFDGPSSGGSGMSKITLTLKESTKGYSVNKSFFVFTRTDTGNKIISCYKPGENKYIAVDPQKTIFTYEHNGHINLVDVALDLSSIPADVKTIVVRVLCRQTGVGIASGKERNTAPILASTGHVLNGSSREADSLACSCGDNDTATSVPIILNLDDTRLVSIRMADGNDDGGGSFQVFLTGYFQ